MDVRDLPVLNAILNASSTVLLLSGYYCIRTGKVRFHRACMIAALFSSSLFLTSYLIYHYHVGSIHFTGEGIVRTVYFTILISHTLLAVMLPPLAVITLSRALRRRYDRHRMIARWTFPIWLYVSATGVMIYFMLYILFPRA